MVKKLRILIVLPMILLAIPVWAQEVADTKPATDTKPAERAAVKKAATDDPNYVIGPQDTLDIIVWKEPGVSRTVTVRPDGKISLPLLSDVQAAGVTPEELSDSLTTKLKKFMEGPQVTVIVTQINSQRIYVIGQVGRPGAYPLLPGMTILQALSSAGGFAQYANEKKTFLMRTVDGKQTKFPFNYKEVISGRKQEQNLLLKPGDQLIVP